MAHKHFMLVPSVPEDLELLGGGDADIEQRFIRSDGSIMWLHTTIRVADFQS